MTMIKNERQYRITKAQAQQFERALAQLTASSTEQTDIQQKDVQQKDVQQKDMHPLLLKAQEEGLQSQLDDLRQQIAEYEALAQGGQTTIVSHSFDELPTALIRARIAAGLSQKELAERLGLKEQQVQRYEATEYAAASLERVRAVIRALGVTVTEEVSLAR